MSEYQNAKAQNRIVKWQLGLLKWAGKKSKDAEHTSYYSGVFLGASVGMGMSGYPENIAETMGPDSDFECGFLDAFNLCSVVSASGGLLPSKRYEKELTKIQKYRKVI